MPNRTSDTKQLEWKNLVERQKESGLSVEKWCRQNHIQSSTFHYWREKLFPKQLQKSSFTQLNMKPPNIISLQANGLQIRISSECDSHVRKQLFALLAELSC